MKALFWFFIAVIGLIFWGFILTGCVAPPGLVAGNTHEVCQDLADLQTKLDARCGWSNPIIDCSRVLYLKDPDQVHAFYNQCVPYGQSTPCDLVGLDTPSFCVIDFERF